MWPKPDISVRTMRESDLSEADRIIRLAFGTFLGLPDPLTFMGDAAYVRPRWLTNPSGAFVAEVDGALAGSVFVSNWGSAGFFGPLTVRPDLWDRGVAKALMGPVVSCFDKWGTKNAGLFTFAHSTKHVALYQKFGFWPRFLTSIMSKPVEKPMKPPHWTRFSEVPKSEQDAMLGKCAALTGSIYEGFDVQIEIRSVSNHKFGETVLLWSGPDLVGFALCHCGPGTEAGSGRCYVKFAAARPGSDADSTFGFLLDACEDFAAQEGLAHLIAGVNMGRHEAYRLMLGRKFHVDYQGVAMQRPNESGYNRPGVYVIDDWR